MAPGPGKVSGLTWADNVVRRERCKTTAILKRVKLVIHSGIVRQWLAVCFRLSISGEQDGVEVGR